MSFQDVGKSKRNTYATTATSTLFNTTAATATNHLSFGALTASSTAPRVTLSSASSSASAPSSGNDPSSGAVSQQLSDGILQYQRHVGILEKIVRQIGSKADGPELESQFQLQVEVLQQLSYRLESLFREEEQSFEQMPRTEAARRRATYVKLSRDYQRVQAQAKNYMLEEKTRRSQLQQRNHPQQRVTTTTTSTSLFSTSNASSIDPEQQIQLQLQIQQDKLAEEIMREREEEIRNINRGMHQVNEIYKDLAHIVGEQQTAIDQIENDMHDARANAESGLQHVEKANAKFSGGGAGTASQCVIS